MAAYYGTEAWVLASRDWGEADRLVTLYAKDIGRIDAVAKGVRRVSSKLRGHLNIFSHTRVLLTPGKDFWRLLDAEADNIPEGSRKLLFAEECREFFLRVVTHALPDEHMWEALLVLRDIDRKDKVVRFKLHILAALGILPEHLEKNIDGQIEQLLAQNHIAPAKTF